MMSEKKHPPMRPLALRKKSRSKLVPSRILLNFVVAYIIIAMDTNHSVAANAVMVDGSSLEDRLDSSSSTSTSDGRIVVTHKKELAPSYGGGSLSFAEEIDEKEHNTAASSNDPYPGLYKRNIYPREINEISKNQAVVMRRRANVDTPDVPFLTDVSPTGIFSIRDAQHRALITKNKGSDIKFVNVPDAESVFQQWFYSNNRLHSVRCDLKVISFNYPCIEQSEQAAYATLQSLQPSNLSRQSEFRLEVAGETEVHIIRKACSSTDASAEEMVLHAGDTKIKSLCKFLFSPSIAFKIDIFQFSYSPTLI